MTGLELSLEWPGCDWMQNRMHVIRGSRRSSGPCEVKVEGTQHLHDPVPVKENVQGINSTIGLEGPGLGSTFQTVSPVAPQSVTRVTCEGDSVVRESTSSRVKSDDDTGVRDLTGPSKNGLVGSLVTPTRPRLIASARRPRYYSSEQARASSIASSSVPSIGGEFSEQCLQFFNCRLT